MKNIVVVFIFLGVALAVNGQNKQVLYNFDELPQTLMLNPGAKANQNWHIGFPLLSQMSFHTGMTGITVFDLYADDGVDINTKIRNAIDRLDRRDHFMINEQIELINAGFALNDRNFLSFGFYQEFDFMLYYPKDIVSLLYDGNTQLNRRYSLSDVNVRTQLLGVLHAGITRKIDDKLQVGGRFKIYSSVFDLKSTRNRASFYTVEGASNLYRHHLNNVDASVQTSGIIFSQDMDLDESYYKKRLFMGGSLGVGIDAGFTFSPEDQWTFTGSILDLGFVYNTKNVRSYTIEGSYATEGIALEFDPDNPINYWEDLKNEFDDSVVLDTLYSNYLSWRPTKLYGSVHHSFGRVRYEDCTKSSFDEPYRNKVGAQLFSVFRSRGPLVAATLFYERRFGKFLRTKITYTADSYSFTNIGLGLSMRLGAFNLFVAGDNVLEYSNVAKASSTSLQFGMNFIFDRKN